MLFSQCAHHQPLQIRPTPPHLTSAMAENILAAACDSESRNAAKRMRLDVYQATVNDSAT